MSFKYSSGKNSRLSDMSFMTKKIKSEQIEKILKYNGCFGDVSIVEMPF